MIYLNETKSFLFNSQQPTLAKKFNTQEVLIYDKYYIIKFTTFF